MGDHAGGAGRVSAGQASPVYRLTRDGYMNFFTTMDAGGFMDVEYAGQKTAYDFSAIQGIQAYTASHYALINSQLRNGAPRHYWSGYVDDPDRAFANDASVLRHPLVTFRDFGSSPEPNLSRMKIGDVFTDNGFTSTTLLDGGLQAMKWGRSVEIRIPAGTRAIWAGQFSHMNEAEVLLKRGTTFKVIGIRDELPILQVVGQ